MLPRHAHIAAEPPCGSRDGAGRAARSHRASRTKYKGRGAGRGDTYGTVAAQNEGRARAINATGSAPPAPATFDGSGGFGAPEGAAERGVRIMDVTGSARPARQPYSTAPGVSAPRTGPNDAEAFGAAGRAYGTVHGARGGMESVDNPPSRARSGTIMPARNARTPSHVAVAHCAAGLPRTRAKRHGRGPLSLVGKCGFQESGAQRNVCFFRYGSSASRRSAWPRRFPHLLFGGRVRWESMRRTSSEFAIPSLYNFMIKSDVSIWTSQTSSRCAPMNLREAASFETHVRRHPRPRSHAMVSIMAISPGSREFTPDTGTARFRAPPSAPVDASRRLRSRSGISSMTSGATTACALRRCTINPYASRSNVPEVSK